MLTASTSSWVKFFTKAGIPSQAAAGYAHVFVENRFQMDMLMDDDGRLHCHPVPLEDGLQPECPRPGAVLAVGSRRGASTAGTLGQSGPGSGGFRHAQQPTQIDGVPKWSAVVKRLERNSNDEEEEDGEFDDAGNGRKPSKNMASKVTPKNIKALGKKSDSFGGGGGSIFSRLGEKSNRKEKAE
ncbi:hypothetical protein quinque_014612 [Culex quinquefasciatus]